MPFNRNSQIVFPTIAVRLVFVIACAVSLNGMLSRSAIVAQQVPTKNSAVRFVDSDGKLLSNVKAFWYGDGKAKRISEVDGKWKTPSTGLVVGVKDGFQFSGVVLDAKSSTQDVLLLRTDEAGPSYETLPIPIAIPAKKQIVESIEKKFFDLLSAKPDDPRNLSACFSVLARLSPDKKIDFIEKNPLEGMAAMMVQQELVTVLSRSNPEQAITLLEDSKDPMLRSVLLGRIIKNIGPESEFYSAIESEFSTSTKAIKNPMQRLAAWSILAEQYYYSDRLELCHEIVDGQIDELRKLPSGGWSGYPRSLYAGLVAERDPELAATLIKGLDKNEINRALGRVAFHCCRANPKKAIEFLNQQKYPANQFANAKNHIKVCHRMAVEQTDSAFELAGSIQEPNQAAWAFALIAKRLADSDPKRARQALTLATELLSNCTTKDDAWFNSSSTTAALLPIAEKLAPEKMNSILWQSVYLSIPRSRWNLGGPSKASKIQTTASAIARYNRPLAKLLTGKKQIEFESDISQTVANQVALNPDGIHNLLDRLDVQRFSGAFHPRRELAELLISSKSEFWNRVSKPTFLDWPIERFEEF